MNGKHKNRQPEPFPRQPYQAYSFRHSQHESLVLVEDTFDICLAAHGGLVVEVVLGMLTVTDLVWVAIVWELNIETWVWTRADMDLVDMSVWMEKAEFWNLGIEVARS